MNTIRLSKRRQASDAGPVLVLKGYGLRLAVERGHLVIEDGIADRRRIRRLSRIDRLVKRITVIGHAGTISLDAIRWLHDVKIPLVHLDTDGRVLAMAAPDSPDHPTLRRAQAWAVEDGTGLMIMQQLLRQKLDGQQEVLRSFTAGQLALPQVELNKRGLTQANDFYSLRMAEARAAAAYWATWQHIPTNFVRKDETRVPAHWLTFGSRTSGLTSSPRLAVNPANAMLNYLYAILEAEARIALLAVGCDPGVGIQHADQRSRDSMACDVMEPLRPEVDAFLLGMLGQRMFKRGDFFETREGNCRLMPSIAQELASTAEHWAKLLGPIVENVAQTLYAQGEKSRTLNRWAAPASKLRRSQLRDQQALPTPLTEQKRKQGRQRLYTQSPLSMTEDGDRQLVPDAQSPREAARSESVAVEPMPADPEQLFIRMLVGQVPITRSTFLQAFVPALRDIPAEDIAAGVGLSVKYCSKIRAGRGTPRRSHWEAFRRLLAKRHGVLPTVD
jgi:CRISPR-associated endonuclease Cas1